MHMVKSTFVKRMKDFRFCVSVVIGVILLIAYVLLIHIFLIEHFATLSKTNSNHRRGMQNVPKVVYLLWDTGWENAPEMQQMCLNSFRRHSADFIINAMNLAEAEYLIDRRSFYNDSVWNLAEIQAKSDIIRVELLARHGGGIWADATVYLNQPLLSWLSDSLLQAGFFAYERRDPLVTEDKKPWIAPWFLVAAEGSEIMQLWRDEVRKCWRNHPLPPKKLGYYWVHRIFHRLVKTNARFKELYDKMPFMDADVPHCWASRWLNPPLYKIKAPGCCEIRELMLNLERQNAILENKTTTSTIPVS